MRGAGLILAGCVVAALFLAAAVSSRRRHGRHREGAPDPFEAAATRAWIEELHEGRDLFGLAADRPERGSSLGRYIEIDTGDVYRWNGREWREQL